MDLFKLVVGIIVDDKDLDKGLDDAKNKTEKAGGVMSKVAGKMGGVVSAVGKATVAGIGAAATGIVAISKSAMSSYADYEQLTGGIETLFKDSSDKMMGFAKDAYKTVGLSANEYMETVTGFSASLIQSLDGDTAQAANRADNIMIAMADNANKMGTSMESIQNAYAGFSKQNFTMLDNLKLGYGGTKEEMQRLLSDAEKLEGYTEGAFDINNFADVAEAIQIIQDNMGITGTTAKEAATTISGSIGMMKSAWENLITGLADPNQDLGALVDNFADAIVTATDNIVPKLVEILPRIANGLTQIIEMLVPYIPPILEQLLPALIDGATAIMQALIDSMPAIIDLLVDIAPLLVVAAIKIVAALVARLPEIISGLIAAIPEIFASIIQGVDEAFPGFIKAVEKGLEGVVEVFQFAFDIVNGYIETQMGYIEDIVSTGVEVLKKLFDFEWKLPKVELPHFNIDGSFSLNPPSVPHLSVDWYAKAMDNPMIMTSPTVFGMNSDGSLRAGGEAGSEVVSGTDTLLNMISNAVEGAISKDVIVSAIVEGLANSRLNMSAELSANSDRMFEEIRIKDAEFKARNSRSAFA